MASGHNGNRSWSSPLLPSSVMVAKVVAVPVAMMAEGRTDFSYFSPICHNPKEALEQSCTPHLPGDLLDMEILTTPNLFLGYKVGTGLRSTFLIRLLGGADAEDPQTNFEQPARGSWGS